nr:nudC domain-containing protein 1 [Onthophagus taurus]
MGPKILDFKPNRQFINPEFDGYKLSLQEIITSKHELEAKVHRAIPNSLQYGYLHAKLFSTHNHLIGRTINDYDFVYFVNNDFKIQKVVYDPSASNEIELINVFQIPKERPSENGDYNVSFKFVNDKFAVVSDGMGLIYIVEINGDIEKWDVVFSEEVLIGDKKFIVQDVKMNENKLYCLLYSISTGDNKDRFLNVLNLITLSKDGDVWGQTGIKELRGGGSLHYAEIDSLCKGIYIAGEKSFKFTLDSDNPIKIDSKDSNKKSYLWLQTTENIKIQFKTFGTFESSDVVINSTTNTIDCSFKGNTFLQGTLFDNINPSSTNWVLSGDLIEITLVKAINNQVWQELIPGDESGEYLTDPALAAEIHEKLSHLCSDKEENVPVGNTFSSEHVEECDFEGDTYCVFERLCFTSHLVTHRYNMDSHKMVLVVKGNDVNGIGLRHDVDTYLWQPILENDEFSLKHFGTLNAFGYVEASKQQKKFTACAPDLSYSVICESNRHVFIYRQKKSVESGSLRNRMTGRQVGFIAQQQVINIFDEIIGVFASNCNLFLLTYKKRADVD